MKKLIFLFLVLPFFANAQANKEKTQNEQALKALLGKTYIKKSTDRPYRVLAYIITEDKVLLQQKGGFTLGYDTLTRKKLFQDFRLPEMVECPICRGSGNVTKSVYVPITEQRGNQSITVGVTTRKVTETCGKCVGTGKVEEASDIQSKNVTIRGAVEAKPKISSINIPIFSLSTYFANKNLPATSDKSLSPNFYHQFKALLTAYLEDVKGDYLGKHEENGKTYALFASKKTLDGFDLATLNLNEKETLWIVAGTIKNNPNNAQLFEYISTELNKLKSDGYRLEDITSGVTNAAKYIRIVKGWKQVGYYLLLKSNDIQVFFTPNKAPLTMSTGVAGLLWFKSATSKPEYGLMDSITQTVIKAPTYTTVNNFSEGLALVSFVPAGYNRRTQYGYIDTAGKEAFPFTDKWSKAHSFSEGLAAVWGGIGWEYIDKTGKVVIGFVPNKKAGYLTGLNAVSDFNGGIAAVKYYSEWGFIDKTGKFIIKPQYDGAENFVNGKAKVKTGTEEFFIDKTGKEVKEN